MRPVLPAALALAACASPPPPVIANRPPPSASDSPAAAPGPAPEPSPRYRGHRLGAVTGHGPPRLSLPAGLDLVSEIRHAEGWRLIVARREADLLVLLADAAGVVSDELAVPDGAGRLETVADCSDAAFLVAIESTACRGDQRDAEAARAWNVSGSELVEVAGPIRCACDLARITIER